MPATPPPLSDEEIAEALERPVGQQPLRELARGASHPIILVDDLTRPTPAGRVIPHLLRQLADAGIPPKQIRILLAPGSHGRIPRDAVAKKVGPEAASACRLLVHDSSARSVKVGRTSFGTRVFVNPEVAASDLVVGVGGVYPQHSTGFGGGAKLAVGVLATRSIVRLHYSHASVGGSYDAENDFRRDLDEVARLIRLRWTVSLHVNAAREPVRLACGDHERYYRDAVAFSSSAYKVPLPEDADVVVANAYPIDVSLTFMHSKGIIPLRHAAPEASRILIAACPEGVGLHKIFPYVDGPRFARQLHLARVAVHRPKGTAGKAVARFRRFGSGRRIDGAAGLRRPIWLFASTREPGSLPATIPDMTAVYDWTEVLEQVSAEQGTSRPLNVAVYPCAPLQVLDLDGPRPASRIPGTGEKMP